jgi:hypothetical protein
MSRLLRVSRNVATALSLVLCVVAVTLWLKSRDTHCVVVADAWGARWQLNSVHGRLWLFRGVPEPGQPPGYLERTPATDQSARDNAAFFQLTIAHRQARLAAEDAAAAVAMRVKHGQKNLGPLLREREALLAAALADEERRMAEDERCMARARPAAAEGASESRLGMRWGKGFVAGGGPYFGVSAPPFVAIPYSILAGGTAVMPVLWVLWLCRRLRRRMRRAPGTCVACGYDMRATPDRCPECGRATT